ncbi:hypothetical protein GQ457_12G018410 [Hibiscus cannabinus]
MDMSAEGAQKIVKGVEIACDTVVGSASTSDAVIAQTVEAVRDVVVDLGVGETDVMPDVVSDVGSIEIVGSVAIGAKSVATTVSGCIADGAKPVDEAIASVLGADIGYVDARLMDPSTHEDFPPLQKIPRPLQGYDPTSYNVNLEEKWCDCGYFQAFKSPCHHAIAACNNCRRDYKNLVDPVYFLHSVCKVYEMEFPAIGSETECHGNQTWPTILPDPKFAGINLDVQLLQGFITQWTCLNESVQDNQNYVVIVGVLVIQ